MTVVALFSALLNFASAAPQENIWASLRQPMPAASTEIFGGYNAGCIAGAVKVPVHSDYFELVNTSRGRFFAHPDLAEFLQTLGRWSVEHYGKLVIGDISQAAGGPLPFGHASHQIGLDADIRFYFLPKEKSLSDQEREGFREVNIATHHMVHDQQGVHIDSNIIKSAWKNAYAEVLRAAAQQARVERIFVSPPIKRELCTLYPEHPEWLRKISPYYGHEEHFHVRLACPAKSHECHAQGAVPLDPTDPTHVGCDGRNLAWWFSTSTDKGSFLADALESETTKPKPHETVMPTACQKLITAKAEGHEKD